MNQREAGHPARAAVIPPEQGRIATAIQDPRLAQRGLKTGTRETSPDAWISANLGRQWLFYSRQHFFYGGVSAGGTWEEIIESHIVQRSTRSSGLRIPRRDSEYHAPEQRRFLNPPTQKMPTCREFRCPRNNSQPAMTNLGHREKLNS